MITAVSNTGKKKGLGFRRSLAAGTVLLLCSGATLIGATSASAAPGDTITFNSGTILTVPGAMAVDFTPSANVTIDPATFALVSYSGDPAAVKVVTVNGQPSLNFTAPTSVPYPGIEEVIEYTASELGNPGNTGTGYIDVFVDDPTVSESNTAMGAYSTVDLTADDQTYVAPLADLVDPNSDAVDPSTMTITSGPATGTATVDSSGAITYIPVGGGSNVIEYSFRPFSSPLRNTVTGSITFNNYVSPLTHTVTASSPTAVTAGTQPVTVAPQDLVTADSDPVDPNSVTVTAPANGSATVNGGAITYTPTEGFVGVDTINYTVSAIDSTPGASSSGTISVTVNPRVVQVPFTAPSWTQDVLAADGAATFDFNDWATATTPGAGRDYLPSVTITKQPDAALGTAAYDAATGVISFTPTLGSSGVATVEYTVASYENFDDIKSGSIVANVNDGLGFAPASTVKLVEGKPLAVPLASLTKATWAVDPASLTVTDVAKTGDFTIDTSKAATEGVVFITAAKGAKSGAFTITGTGVNSTEVFSGTFNATVSAAAVTPTPDFTPAPTTPAPTTPAPITPAPTASITALVTTAAPVAAVTTDAVTVDTLANTGANGLNTTILGGLLMGLGAVLIGARRLRGRGARS